MWKMKMHGRATTTIPESLFFDYSDYQAPLTKKNQLISYALPGTLPRIIFRLWQLPLLSNLKNPFSSNRSLKNQPKALLKWSPSPSKYLPTSTQKSLTSHSLLLLAKRVLPLPKYLSNAPFSPQPSQAKLCSPLFFRKPLLSAKATSRELFSFLSSFSPPFPISFSFLCLFSGFVLSTISAAATFFYLTPSAATFSAPLLLQPPFLHAGPPFRKFLHVSKSYCSFKKRGWFFMAIKDVTRGLLG